MSAFDGVRPGFGVTQVRVASCRKCGDRGWYMYDHNHGKPCDACCTHPGGWWVLDSELYGGTDERYAACKSPGCGTTISRSDYARHEAALTEEACEGAEVRANGEAEA